MTFWTSLGADPKRQYRFKVTIGSMPNSAQYYIKTTNKPGLKISAKEHMYLGHKFFYPGMVTWEPNPLEIKMVDPATPDAAANLTAIIQASGYIIPKDEGTLKTISKQRASNSLGSVVITVIDENGDKLEEWTLKNSFLESVKFGDLDYSKEDLSEVTLQVRYDWCELFTKNPVDSAAAAKLEETQPGSDLNTRFKTQ